MRLNRSERFINHNVKYDAHVLFNNYEFSYSGEYADTLTLAKLVDSDRMCNGGYRLDALSKAYLHLDLSRYYDSLKPYLATKGRNQNKDYGAIPMQVLADYSGNQVQANRKLYLKLCELLPEEVRQRLEDRATLDPNTDLIRVQRTSNRRARSKNC